MPIEQGLGVRCHGTDLTGQTFQSNLGLVQPVLVVVAVGEIMLDLCIVDDAALFHVDQEHLAGLQAPFFHNAFFCDVEHAHLRGHHDDIVIGNQVTCRAQAVAVEGGADLAAIGEGNSGRAVPGFHDGGVVFVEGAALFIHQGVAGPGLGDQQHHGMCQRVTAANQ